MKLNQVKFISILNFLIELSLVLLLISLPFSSRADAVYMGSIVIAALASCCRNALTEMSRRFWFLILLEIGVILILSMSVLAIVYGAGWFTLWRSFLKNVLLPLIVIIILSHRLPFSLGRNAPELFRHLFQIALAGLMLFVVLNVLSAFAGTNPGASFLVFRNELALYTAIFLVILNYVENFTHLKRLILTLYFVGLLVSLVAISENILFYLGDYTVKRTLLRFEYVSPFFRETINPVRSQYPFEHHTQLGFFLLCSVLITVPVYFMTKTRYTRRWVGLSSVLPILGMALTHTRSSMIALIFALILVLSLTRWRSLVWLMLFLVLLFEFAPSAVRQNYLSLFRRENYRENVFSAYLRFISWDFAQKIIKTYPQLGIGYGERNYEFPKFKYFAEKTGSIRDEGVISRNTYLQIVCESGVVSGLSFIISFISLIILLLGTYLKTELPVLYRRISASLLGLMTGIATFMLTNYVLNYSSGMLVWVIFALSLSFIRIIYPEEWAAG